MPVYVSWNEVREDAYCFIIADLTTNGWEFWERDSWEIRWFRMKATSELSAKAESFLRNQEIATAVPTLRTWHEGERLSAGSRSVSSRSIETSCGPQPLNPT
jgi:hypothetical protein